MPGASAGFDNAAAKIACDISKARAISSILFTSIGEGCVTEGTVGATAAAEVCCDGAVCLDGRFSLGSGAGASACSTTRGVIGYEMCENAWSTWNGASGSR